MGSRTPWAIAVCLVIALLATTVSAADNVKQPGTKTESSLPQFDRNMPQRTVTPAERPSGPPYAQPQAPAAAATPRSPS